MPRFFFHLQNGEKTRDEEGIELADLDSARAQAVRAGSQMLADGRHTFWQTAPWNIVVTDNAGVTVGGLEMRALPDLLAEPVG